MRRLVCLGEEGRKGVFHKELLSFSGNCLLECVRRMQRIKTKAVFGPVPSRRLGVSLGVDLLPYKTCSMDCVYCECGATTCLTSERKEYFPTASVIAEIDEVLAAGRKIDYLTFSGVGEPTLHSGIGAIIEHVRQHWPDLKICLLTNGTLLGSPELQKELRHLDLIVPSLDGSCEEEFRLINRPAPGVTLASVRDAILSFRKTNSCPMWLEIFIVPGVNDSPESAARFRDLAAQISPDKVQLNSLDRPGVEDWIEIPTTDELESVAALIREKLPVEIVSKVRPVVSAARHGRRVVPIAEYNENILKTVRSRPCTGADIALALNYDPDKVASHLRRMEKAGLLVSEDGERGRFYRPAEKLPPA